MVVMQAQLEQQAMLEQLAMPEQVELEAPLVMLGVLVQAILLVRVVPLEVAQVVIGNSKIQTNETWGGLVEVELVL